MCCSALQHWYFSICRTFPRSDSCFQTAQTPLIDGQGRNRSATQAWEWFLRRASSMLQEEWSLESLISGLILTLFSSGFVFPDLTDTHDRQPERELHCSAGLSSWFWSQVSFAAEGEQWPLWISWNRLALFSRGFVSKNEKNVFYMMHRKLDWFLENCRNRFCGEHWAHHVPIVSF